jgi:hypothetical protein
MRKRAILVFVAAIVLLLALRFLLEPQRATGFLLARIGNAMGLEISASGSAEYHLRGTPTLVLRDVVVREPGAAVPLMRADRIYLSLPWSTLRARGAVLDATRIELDAPILDLTALQHWLAGRPPSESRMPSLAKGLRIRDGRIHGDGWDIDGIQVELPLLAPESPLHARLRGRYLDPPLAIPFDLGVAIVRPAAVLQSARTGFAAAGSLVVQRGADGRLPATVMLSGPLLFDQAVWLLAPAHVVLHGDGNPASDLIPALDARGSLALGRRLILRLQGDLATWPAAWPSLPEPLASSPSRLPFALDYTGSPDLTDVALLRLQRDAAGFDARFRLQDLQAWLAGDAKEPLPPLDGHLHAPRMDIAGARLEGVEIELDEPGIRDVGP